MSQASPPRIDLVIPARNEQENMADLLAAIPPGVFRHVIVADNGSTDDTAQLAQAAGAVVVHEPRPGYGGACLAGLAYLEGLGPEGAPTAVAFLDADLADDPEGLPRILEPILMGAADLVIGCRQTLAQPGALDPHQRFGNRLACVLLWLSTGQRYRDVGPLRAIRWTSLRAIAMTDRTWGWTVEMQFKAATQGLRIEQINVPYRRRHAGKSKISGSLAGSFKAGVKIISTLASLWWRQRGFAGVARQNGTRAMESR